MFGIKTASDFFAKAKSDLDLFATDIAESSAAMNSILSMYHLHEWVWSRWLKGRFDAQAKLRIRNSKDEFVGWIDGQFRYFSVLQELANGTKHAIPAHSTQAIAGYARGPFGIGPYGKAYLLIDLGDHIPSEDRYLTADKVLREALAFWSAFFKDHHVDG